MNLLLLLLIFFIYCLLIGQLYCLIVDSYWVCLLDIDYFPFESYRCLLIILCRLLCLFTCRPMLNLSLIYTCGAFMKCNSKWIIYSLLFSVYLVEQLHLQTHIQTQWFCTNLNLMLFYNLNKNKILFAFQFYLKFIFNIQAESINSQDQTYLNKILQKQSL
jgi:hypothetical protein